MNQENVDKAFEKMNELHTEMNEQGVTDAEFLTAMIQLRDVIDALNSD